MKKIFFTAGAMLVIVAVWNWSLISYGVAQGMGQFKIIFNARPIEEVLNDPEFPDSLKQKLAIVEEIRRFAIDSLGLKDTENYKTVFDQKGQELMWVVTASEPYQLKSFTWQFPVVGKVPYKGFFEIEKAQRELETLKSQGYDVGVRNPGGWSTLGWFTDPILSEMLKRNEGDLASLIIHEMVHATVFVKDSIDFNENLASFIADTAAFDFIKWKYGAQSKEYLVYLDETQDHAKYSNHIMRGSQSLDSLYGLLHGESEEFKQARKEEMIKKIVASMDTLTLKEFKIPTSRFNKNLPNNDYFLAYLRYGSKQDNFKAELHEKFTGNLRLMVKSYEKRFPFL
ncbi:MAG: aminopeptidase [Cyclobacteriaceae bacterium]